MFWAHLSVAVGLVVLLLSATGTLLTDERQIVATAERRAFAVPPRVNSREGAQARSAPFGRRRRGPSSGKRSFAGCFDFCGRL